MISEDFGYIEAGKVDWKWFFDYFETFSTKVGTIDFFLT